MYLENASMLFLKLSANGYGMRLLTLFQMTMGQYDPERTDLSAIARISGLGLPNFMTLFLFILCKSTQGHFDIRFQKS